MPGIAASLSPAWIWLGTSFALAVLATNLRWMLRNPAPGLVAEAVAQLRGLPGGPALHQALRLAFFVGVPFAALLLGHDAVTERYLGVQVLKVPDGSVTASGSLVAVNWLNWAQDTGWAAAAGAGALVILLVAWATYRRALAAHDLRETAPLERPSGWMHLREAAIHEVHWAFYRNAPLIALRARPDGSYWGIWIGLGIVGLEALLNPAWRHGLSIPEHAPPKLMRVVLALLSGLLYWRTENLWLAIGAHMAISWAIAAIAAATTRPPS